MYYSHNYDNYAMFQDVPGCSGIFDVPGFIDRQIYYGFSGFGDFLRSFSVLIGSYAPHTNLPRFQGA